MLNINFLMLEIAVLQQEDKTLLWDNTRGQDDGGEITLISL